jgi:hypothetical protein
VSRRIKLLRDETPDDAVGDSGRSREMALREYA